MSKYILVVADQEDNRKSLRDLLGNAGYEPEAENGEEGDSLPSASGGQTSVPIIAVRSHALVGDEDKALAAGYNGMICGISIPAITN